MLRAIVLALVVAFTVTGCTPTKDGPQPVPVDLGRPLILYPVVDPGGVLDRISAAVRDDPASGLIARDGLIGHPGGDTTHEAFPTGPTRQVLEDYVRAHPELAPPEGFLFAYERLDARMEEPSGVRWRLHCLRRQGAVELRHLAGASVRDSLGRADILINLSPEDGAAFTRLTGELVGQRMAVVHDLEVLMAPMVQEPIEGNAFSISLAGDGSPAAANATLARLVAP